MRLAGVLIAGVLSVTASAQSPTAEPRFEVISIKANRSGEADPVLVSPEPTGYRMINGTAAILIRLGYPVDSRTWIGLPSWASDEHYDLTARTAAPASLDRLAAMMRNALSDRFQLQAHYETRDSDAYELRVAKADGTLGPNLKRYSGDCAADTAALVAGQPRPALSRPTNGATPCRVRIAPGTLMSGGTSIQGLAGSLAGPAGRYVIDKTGLTGLYEYSVTYSLMTTTSQDDQAPPLVTALLEQLGLRLQPVKVPLPVVVIDHIERPSEN